MLDPARAKWSGADGFGEVGCGGKVSGSSCQILQSRNLQCLFGLNKRGIAIVTQSVLSEDHIRT